MTNTKAAKNPTEQEIQEWFISYLTKNLDILDINDDQVDVDIDAPFDRYGMSSAESIEMTGVLAEWIGVKLEPELIYNYPTIKAMTEYLTEKLPSLNKY